MRKGSMNRTPTGFTYKGFIEQVPYIYKFNKKLLKGGEK